jgi:hypothetical protein
VQRNSDLAFKKNFYPGIFGVSACRLQNAKRLLNIPYPCLHASFPPKFRATAACTNKNACIFAQSEAGDKPKNGSKLNVKLTLLKNAGAILQLVFRFYLKFNIALLAEKRIFAVRTYCKKYTF